MHGFLPNSDILRSHMALSTLVTSFKASIQKSCRSQVLSNSMTMQSNAFEMEKLELVSVRIALPGSPKPNSNPSKCDSDLHPAPSRQSSAELRFKDQATPRRPPALSSDIPSKATAKRGRPHGIFSIITQPWAPSPATHSSFTLCGSTSSESSCNSG